MIIRRSTERGHANHGWLDSYHSFSFADYYDPAHMGFRSLRVINEDRIKGGTGFATHGHRDMEIISYVIEGALEHKDTMGNSTVIRPSEVQYMSAGSGVRHSEFNHHSDKEGHFLQIWILPKLAGTTPRYGQKSFQSELDSERLTLVVSPDGQEGSIAIHQDARIWAARSKKEKSWQFETKAPNALYLHVVRGSVDVNGSQLQAGDSAYGDELQKLDLTTREGVEFLIFELGRN